MATCVTPCAAIQSAIAKRSRVIVPQWRACSCQRPFGSIRRTQASTDSLWTSKPAQQGKMFSMIVSSTPAPEDIESVKQSAPRALAEARRQFGVRSDVQARLFSGLEAPSNAGLHPAQAEWIINRSRVHFHASWVSRSDMRTCSENLGHAAARDSRVT